MSPNDRSTLGKVMHLAAVPPSALVCWAILGEALLPSGLWFSQL